MSNAGLLQTCLLLGTFIPLISFALLVFLGSRLTLTRPRPGGQDPAPQRAPGEPLAGWVATVAIGISLALAIVVAACWHGLEPAARLGLGQAAADSARLWTMIGRVPVYFGLKLDSLTVIMFLMVTICATCIHVFSLGYMRSDPRFARFFAFMSLFCFSMLGLVIVRSLLLLFVFWELVGLCSYFLIGFWFERKSASDAGLKAFVVNRVGDFGFLVGLGLCYLFLHTLSLDGAAAAFAAGAHQAGWAAGAPSAAAAGVWQGTALKASQLFTTQFLGVSLATWLGVALFCGAVGKSAQFPLQVWLPDAMEGPTPVSALIHAATMVAAGVYLVARVFGLLTPAAQALVALVGCVTLTMAALIAIVQTDIKRVLAYSTLSQLGYMVFGLGIGAWVGALFHLMTHAFFKALLFLGAGQVIAGCHHEQDMRRLGGLSRKMPITAGTFLVAVLAISGAGIPGLGIGIGGYYSKDEILAVAYYRCHHWSAAGDPPGAAGDYAAAYGGGAHAVRPLGRLLYLLPVVVAYVTPFYMGRCFMLTFLGRPRDRHLYAQARESPLMYLPLMVLAALSVLSGVWLFRACLADALPDAAPLVPAIDFRRLPAHLQHAVHGPLAASVGPAFLVGLGLAWLIYRRGFELSGRIRTLPVVRQAHRALCNKLYFDHVYDTLFRDGVRWVLATICRLFDDWIIDGLVNSSARLTERISRFSGVVLDNLGVDGLVNGLAWLAWTLGGALRRVQTGAVRNYILLAALAVASALLGRWSAPAGLILFLAGAAVLVVPRSGRPAESGGALR